MKVIYIHSIAHFSERGAAVYLGVVDHERTGRLVPIR